VFFDPRIGVTVARGERDTFGAAADGSFRALIDDLVRGHGDGLEPGGAEAIDGGRCDGDGQSSKHGGHASDVRTLRTVGLRAAQDNVLDFGGIELRSLA